jgi:crotonobetainyl-CoA:carnitine CoA-transferase CaiB-like acyl-CoA transferase
MVEAPLPAGPLAGVTVVTLEHAIPSPFATRQLADRVIKIERPGVGDFARLRRLRARPGLALRLVQPL